MATAKRTPTIGLADPAQVEPAFVGTPKSPGPEELAAALGPAHRQWTALLGFVSSAVPTATTEWKHATAKSGWSLTVRDKKRNLVYLRPSEKRFLASFAFKENAVEAALQAELPPALIAAIQEAPIFPEGKAVRIAVRTRQEGVVARTLLRIKIDN